MRSLESLYRLIPLSYLLVFANPTLTGDANASPLLRYQAQGGLPVYSPAHQRGPARDRHLEGMIWGKSDVLGPLTVAQGQNLTLPSPTKP
jgi:hypothetical protein